MIKAFDFFSEKKRYQKFELYNCSTIKFEEFFDVFLK